MYFIFLDHFPGLFTFGVWVGLSKGDISSWTKRIFIGRIDLTSLAFHFDLGLQ